VDLGYVDNMLIILMSANNDKTKQFVYIDVTAKLVAIDLNPRYVMFDTGGYASRISEKGRYRNPFDIWMSEFNEKIQDYDEIVKLLFVCATNYDNYVPGSDSSHVKEMEVFMEKDPSGEGERIYDIFKKENIIGPTDDQGESTDLVVFKCFNMQNAFVLMQHMQSSIYYTCYGAIGQKWYYYQHDDEVFQVLKITLDCESG
jgi:hypothetical protein